MNEALNRLIWGNTILSYLYVVSAMIICWIILKLSKKVIVTALKKMTKKTTTRFDDLLVEAAERFLIPYIYLVINYYILRQLNLSIGVEKVLQVAAMFVTTYYAVRLINFIIQHLVVAYMKSKNEPAERIRQVQGMLTVIKVITWVSGFVMLADNLGYNVTTIIAGFGVGGIAIALAAQSILGDLFSYIVIFFDKPFEIGDFIIAGDHMGIVEKIGIKTSHVRSLDGQQLIMPNAEMAKSVIQNFKRLQRRRVVFSIGIVYYTPAVKMRAIPDMIKAIVSKEENATFDRAHFKSFGDFSINYEIVYYVESADYLTYMNIQQAICMNIFEKFEKEGIEFAFPTQTLFLNNQTNTNNSETKENNNTSIRTPQKPSFS